MSLLGRMLIALAAIVILFIGGYYLSLIGSTDTFTWLPTPKYVGELGANIGVAGFDALVVGGIAGFVSAEIATDRQRRRRAHRLQLRRGPKRSLLIKTEADTGLTHLPLWGFSFSGQKVEDAIVDSARFGAPKAGETASTFNRVEFHDCVMTKVSFSGRAGSSTLSDSSFIDSDLLKCDFRGTTITADQVADAFDGSTLRQCKFDGAVITGVRFDGATLDNCSFWRAELDGTLLSKAVYDPLIAIGAIVNHPTGRAGHVLVVSWYRYQRLRFSAWLRQHGFSNQR
ncbi:pentapeptide repeat-containing protein [Sphingomonas sp. BIUV-7]|uniref:Pentapeptide repeat-containing protein n=1 Tax=Sphingomonas natans TaxID=3063330 RepID=A0ABT8YAR2_9SPHN|nr:pentapeptide repeat-containing protein [Sphingomonas sp. BIUV-7]MDO6415405.1 pentapeptide repeat-containing protein [Sphingomonas sp. BIUV-7]